MIRWTETTAYVIQNRQRYPKKHTSNPKNLYSTQIHKQPTDNMIPTLKPYIQDYDSKQKEPAALPSFTIDTTATTNKTTLNM